MPLTLEAAMQAEKEREVIDKWMNISRDPKF